MAVATQQMPTLLLSEEVKSAPETTHLENTSIYTVNDLFLSKARDTPHAVFVQYPATDRGKSDYVSYTVANIDRLVDEAARQYAQRGLIPNVSLSVAP